jgi:hypothetical protein
MAGTIATAENAYIKDNTTNAAPTLWPLPKFNSRAIPGTFVARDNIHSFIVWSRAFGVPESALFETEDLVAGKKLKNVLYVFLFDALTSVASPTYSLSSSCFVSSTHGPRLHLRIQVHVDGPRTVVAPSN